MIGKKNVKTLTFDRAKGDLQIMTVPLTEGASSQFSVFDIRVSGTATCSIDIFGSFSPEYHSDAEMLSLKTNASVTSSLSESLKKESSRFGYITIKAHFSGNTPGGGGPGGGGPGRPAPGKIKVYLVSF